MIGARKEGKAPFTVDGRRYVSLILGGGYVFLEPEEGDDLVLATPEQHRAALKALRGE